MPGLDSSILTFLEDLKSNNNRNWFIKNKSLFDEINLKIKAFASNLSNELDKHDKIESWWKSNSTEIAKNEFCEAYASDCIDTLNSSLKYLYKKNANN